jgi:hypothetical protein
VKRFAIVGLISAVALTCANASASADDLASGESTGSNPLHVSSRAVFKNGLVHLNSNADKCAAQPTDGVRQRIIDVAFGAWAAFGEPSLDLSSQPERVRGFATPTAPTPRSEEGSLRLAMIAGFWAITPTGRKYIDEQNQRWSQARDQEWQEHWSAAFTSWVMCEAGLDETQFARSVNHFRYVQHALSDELSAFKFMTAGSPAAPGDLLCAREDAASSNVFNRLEELRGRPLHCFVVVETGTAVTYVIGGNVIDWSKTPLDKYGTVGLLIINNAAVTARGSGEPCPGNKPCWVLGLGLKNAQTASYKYSSLSSEAKALFDRR